MEDIDRTSKFSEASFLLSPCAQRGYMVQIFQMLEKWI